MSSPKTPPHRLPPLRRIEHQIDLMSGVSIPNRPTYRSNPEETKESQRQVESLIEKGWVRESLSPCSMPIVLVNRILSPLLRCFVGKNLKAWEECLPHSKFAQLRVYVLGFLAQGLGLVFRILGSWFIISDWLRVDGLGFTYFRDQGLM